MSLFVPQERLLVSLNVFEIQSDRGETFLTRLIISFMTL